MLKSLKNYKKLLELISDFSTATEHTKMSHNKSYCYILTMNIQNQKFKTMPFAVIPKKMKYVGLNMLHPLGKILGNDSDWSTLGHVSISESNPMTTELSYMIGSASAACLQCD